MGTDGIDFVAKIDMTMSDGGYLVCSGAFITPHVVITAAHCTRNYDFGSVVTPTTNTVIHYGTNFASSQKIAGDENVGWRELGSTDIGLYRVADAVTLPVLPKLYRSCSTVDLKNKKVVVYGREIDGTEASFPKFYMSPERPVLAVVNGIGANGTYLQIEPTTDEGDSGGPWVYGGDRIVATTHAGNAQGSYGARACDVSDAIEAQVKAWNDTITFVEDVGTGGAGGTSAQGGMAGSTTSDAGAGGSAGATGRGGAGGSASSDAGAGGAATGGSSGQGGTSHTSSGTSESNTGGVATGGNRVSDSGAKGGAGGRSSTGAGGAVAAGTTGHHSDTGGSGCSFIPRKSHPESPGGIALLIAVLGLAGAGRMRPTTCRGGHIPRMVPEG